MKKRNVISILLYLLGAALFVISNSAVVSGSPIHLTYFQRVVLCGAAVCSIGTAPFIYQFKTRAGMVMKLLEPSEATKDKLTSIGYGFFIPIFFIMTGVGLNLRSLFGKPSSLMLLPGLVIFLLIAKLPVVLTYMRYFQKRNAFAGGFLTATTITIVLPTLQVARKLHAITSTQSDAFILAAV